jgi:hypothetical protein
VWRLPAYNIVHSILTNPIYAGAYAFGRTTSRVSVVDGRKRIRRGVHRPMAEWDVLIKDNHAAYITWDEFERNLKAIANNATSMSSALTRGAAREGELLLPGLLRCGHCGRKLHVHYGGRLGRYNCYGARTKHGAERCISVSGLSIDAAIAKEVLRVLKPLGIEAAVKAINAQSNETTAAQRQLELSLQQARYEAAHARRQYDAVDPTNRLVAGELERRWNEALQSVCREDRRRDRGNDRATSASAWRARTAATDGTRCRPRARLVASGSNSCNTQAHSARRNLGDRRAPGWRDHPCGPALARWRPYGAAGEAAA